MLSYVWGEDQPSHAIILAKQPFGVRQNLWDFLHRAQEEDIRYLWIDALCVDQGSNSERNHQVAMMGQIYSKAAKVIAWLGVGPTEMVEAVEKIRVGEDNAFKYERVLHERVFASAEYWRRAWIAQEFVLAQRLEIRCGHAIVESFSGSIGINAGPYMKTSEFVGWECWPLRRERPKGLRFDDFTHITNEAYLCFPMP